MSTSSTQTILIVDDIRANRMLLSYFLRDMGYDYREAGSGEDVARILDSDPIDLILLDMNLPDEHGLDVSRKIRARGGDFLLLPIICVSASEETRAELQAAGVNDRLDKPFELQQVRKIVQKWLPIESGGARMSPAKAETTPPKDADIPVFVVADMDRLRGPGIRDHDALVRELLDEFARSAPESMTACDAAFAADDARGVALHAHTLKGSAASIGGQRLSAVARRVEMAAKADDLALARRDQERLRRELDALLTAIRDHA